MAWVSGSVVFENPSFNQKQFKGDIVITQIDTLVLHGVVLDSDGKTPVKGALVKAFARLKDDKEQPLNHSLTGTDGYYLMTVDKQKIPQDVTALIVRVGAGIDSPGE